MKKNPGRKERRRFHETAMTIGFGSQDKYLYKKAKKRRDKKRRAKEHAKEIQSK